MRIVKSIKMTIELTGGVHFVEQRNLICCYNFEVMKQFYIKTVDLLNFVYSLQIYSATNIFAYTKTYTCVKLYYF